MIIFGTVKKVISVSSNYKSSYFGKTVVIQLSKTKENGSGLHDGCLEVSLYDFNEAMKRPMGSTPEPGTPVTLKLDFEGTKSDGS